MTRSLFVYIAQMSMFGATLHYLFLTVDVSKALACLTIGTLLLVDQLIDQGANNDKSNRN